MKILHVIGSLSRRYGGPPKTCIEMSQALASRGHVVDIFTTDQEPGGSRSSEESSAPECGGVTIYNHRANLLRAWPGASLDLALALRNKIPEYDIVHTHGLYSSHGIAVSYYCRQNHVPYVIRPCGALDPIIFYRHRFKKSVYERLFERRHLKRAAAVHFTSVNELENADRVMSVRNGVVIPHGVNIEECKPGAASAVFRARYRELAGQRYILFLSRISRKKGLDLLIPAFATIARRRTDVKLVIAGPDDEGYGASVSNWIDQHSIRDRVLITGMLEGELKCAAFREASFFVLPSYGENFGIAVAEAMAYGVPVLVTKGVALSQEIQQSGAGFVVEPDVCAIAAAMDKLLLDAHLCSAMKEAGRELIAERFSWSRAAALLEEMYLRILATQ